MVIEMVHSSSLRKYSISKLLQYCHLDSPGARVHRTYRGRSSVIFGEIAYNNYPVLLLVLSNSFFVLYLHRPYACIEARVDRDNNS